MKLVWRGGRRFKAKAAAAAAPAPTAAASGPSGQATGKDKQNGRSGAPKPPQPPVDVMIIDDSDDEAPAPLPGSSSAAPAATPSFVAAAPAEFEPDADDAYATVDAGSAAAALGQPRQPPFPDTVQTLDLPLGTAVLRVAVPNLVPCAAEDAGLGGGGGGEDAAAAAEGSGRGGGVDVLKTKLVFAAAAASGEVYLFAVPLTPPSDEAKRKAQEAALAGAAPGLHHHNHHHHNHGAAAGGLAGAGSTTTHGAWGESQLLLGQQDRPSIALALGLVAAATTTRGKSTPTVTERKASTGGTDASTRTSSARIVVASATREASGTLRMWDVPLSSFGSITTTTTTAASAAKAARPVEPFQTEYLPSPIASLSFNPSRATHLLAVFPSAAVRVYDFAAPSAPQDEGDAAAAVPWPTQGSWLLSLYAPFVRQPTGGGGAGDAGHVSAASFSTLRRPVLDAAWVARGRAVLALLADGAWGIWDVEGLGPPAAGPASGGVTGGGGGGGGAGQQAASTSALVAKSAGVRGGALTAFAVSGYLEGSAALRSAQAAAAGLGASFSAAMTTSGAGRRSGGGGGSVSGSFNAGGPAADFVPMSASTRSAGGPVTVGLGGGGAAGGGPSLVSPATEHARLSAVRGQVLVQALPYAVPRSAKDRGGGGGRHRPYAKTMATQQPLAGEESAVLFLSTASVPGSEIVVAIPAVARFWEAQARRGAATNPNPSGGGGGGVNASFNLFATGGGGGGPASPGQQIPPAARPVRLVELALGLGGERAGGVGAVVRGFGLGPTASSSSPGVGAENGDHDDDEDPRADDAPFQLPLDILVRAETRLVAVRETGAEGVGARIGGVVGWKAKSGASPASKRLGGGGGGGIAGMELVARAATATPGLASSPEQQQKQRAAAALVSAITVEGGARQDAAARDAFNLTVGRGRSIATAAAAAAAAADQAAVEEEDPAAPGGLHARRADAGLAFAESLNRAADTDMMTLPLTTGGGGGAGAPRTTTAGGGDVDMMMLGGNGGGRGSDPDDEDGPSVPGAFGADRNVEEEMLDVMDIERTLAEMEDDRRRGGQAARGSNVFFEDS